MQLNRLIITMLLLLAWCSMHQRADAREPWSDPRLPVENGLAWWLDASHPAQQVPPTSASGQPLSSWWDASGNRRDLHVPTASSQPTWHRTGDTAIVRMDGIDDVMRGVQSPGELSEFDLWLVAVPRANPGIFRGLLAFNRREQRDYESGFNLDFGPTATAEWTMLNLEARGAGGATNLLTQPRPWRQPARIHVQAAADLFTLWVDGQSNGVRSRKEPRLAWDEVTLGARYYNNQEGPQQIAGPGAWDIAELLLYDRPLSEEERRQVETYLSDKYANLAATLPASTEASDPWPHFDHPPAVQMLVPGFEAMELPIELPNINNLIYRHDEVLVAMGYNGNLWLLKDTDGDGIEDQAKLFWDAGNQLRGPIGMAWTPPGYPHGQGAVIASKGQITLVFDRDGDDIADGTQVLAGGWPEIAQSVDTLGVAFHPKDHSLWFGRGTGDYTQAYRIDGSGKATYQLEEETGTIQRLSADLKERTTVATGIRFPVALRFNSLGDLFATEQEGATWLANGNPWDELLHIQTGRHYGFPPFHPVHLPNVQDEPSVYDYQPQHQSTCGLVFNETAFQNSLCFGPEPWRGNAFVCGYSRGKLYRTALAKTAWGYVAGNQLIGCLQQLTVDAAVGPDGSMTVACHSGGPDWGSGPQGKGTLYRIVYRNRQTPQPVHIWADGPRRLQVGFDRPVPLELGKQMLERAVLQRGPFVYPGDRFERLWPGYGIVQMQRQSKRQTIAIHTAQWTPDGRTLSLETDPIDMAESFALTIPSLLPESHLDEDADTHSSAWNLPATIRPVPETELGFDLHGVEATWQSTTGTALRAILPHPDPLVARKLSGNSDSQTKLLDAIEFPGTMTYAMRLDTDHLVFPHVQADSTLDFAYPEATVELCAESNAPFQVRFSQRFDSSGEETSEHATWKDAMEDQGRWKWSHQTVSKTSRTGKTLPGTIGPAVEVRIRTGQKNPLEWSIGWRRKDKPDASALPRPLPVHRFWLPWAIATDSPLPSKASRSDKLASGDWGKGRQIFFSSTAGCSRCHAIHGTGPRIGPDLTNLIHRDYDSVYRDIAHPNAAINPDHLSYNLLTADGQLLVGTLEKSTTGFRIWDAKGTLQEVASDDVQTLKVADKSLMPEGIPELLGEDAMNHLMAFLLQPPPSMPIPEGMPGAPPVRSRSEVEQALQGGAVPSDPLRTIRLLLVAGPKDHGPGEHDYPAWQKMWSQLMSAAPQVELQSAWEWPDSDQWAWADAVVFFQRGNWDDQRASDLDRFLQRGGGATWIHWAVDGRQQGEQFAQRIGLAGAGAIAYRHGPLDLVFPKESDHPIRRNMERLSLVDESYWNLAGDPNQILTLADSMEEGQLRPQVWVSERGEGRVFVSIPGHYSWSFDDPLFRLLLLRGIAWTAKESVDRWNDLVWPGASVAPANALESSLPMKSYPTPERAPPPTR
jgi:putative heme-binding domain-containing protein